MRSVANSGGPAFPPVNDPRTHPSGLTKLEWFAGLAMQAMLSRPDNDLGPDALARAAFVHADSMLTGGSR